MSRRVLRILSGLLFATALVLTSAGPVGANESSWFANSVFWYHQGYGPSDHPSGNLCYNAHIAGVGWQGWRCNGATAGNGAGRIEAVAFWTSAGSVMMQGHMQLIGWGNTALTSAGSGTWIGTTSQSRRLEAIAIQRTNLAGYQGCMSGQAYVQGLGWQPVQHSDNSSGNNDIMTLGTRGQSRAMYYFWLSEAC